MMTTRRLSAAICAGAMAMGLPGVAFGQADNTNSLIAPAPAPSYSQRDQYSYSQSDRYNVSRQAYMEEAGRRWDAAAGIGQSLPTYESERLYGRPYASDAFGSPRPGLTQDSNPDEYATGIYNPKH